MKKLLLSGCSIGALCMSLSACGLWTTSNSDVVYTPGDAVVTPAGGTDVWVGRPVTRHDRILYKQKGTLHKGGHVYRVQHGKYVLVR